MKLQIWRNWFKVLSLCSR